MEWIKCSERLPEEGDRLLIMVDNSVEIGCRRVDKIKCYIDHKGKEWPDALKGRVLGEIKLVDYFISEIGGCHYCDDDDHRRIVTHWMQLPQLSKSLA